MAVSQEKKTVGKWEFFQLSHKCHWSVVVVTEERLELQGNSCAGVGVGGQCEAWRLSAIALGPLNLPSAVVICRAATALACFSLTSMTLKYVNTSCSSTLHTLKDLPAGSWQHRLPGAVSLPYPICRLESSSSFGPHAWRDAQVVLLSSVLLGFMMRPLETMQWLQDPNQKFSCTKCILQTQSEVRWVTPETENGLFNWWSPCTLNSLFQLKMSVMYNSVCFYLQFNNKWLLWSSARVATVNQQDPYQTTDAMK